MPAQSASPFTQFTRCPHCFTVFGVKKSQLSRAEGKVRCGNCFKLFNAMDAIVDNLQHGITVIRSIGKSKQQRAHMNASISTLANTSQNNVKNKSAQSKPPLQVEPAQTTMANLAHQMAQYHYVSPYQHKIRQKANTKTYLWASISLLLAFLIIGQYGWFNREQLATYPALYPALSTLCTWLGCTLPPYVNPADIEIKSRSLNTHPDLSNTLRLHIIISNKSKFYQPFATLDLKFTDLSGKLLATRSFQPEDYLNAEQITNLMPPQTPVHIVLDMTDPGARATGFELAFH